mmetsp:Transcript_56759/g.120749  ORF Transcript_56759/g.120749 Transcript_56759/m.120749 type:complete len:214 (+) Transcript_56759:852-1493(+)
MSDAREGQPQYAIKDRQVEGGGNRIHLLKMDFLQRSTSKSDCLDRLSACARASSVLQQDRPSFFVRDESLAFCGVILLVHVHEGIALLYAIHALDPQVRRPGVKHDIEGLSGAADLDGTDVHPVCDVAKRFVDWEWYIFIITFVFIPTLQDHLPHELVLGVHQHLPHWDPDHPVVLWLHRCVSCRQTLRLPRPRRIQMTSCFGRQFPCDHIAL